MLTYCLPLAFTKMQPGLELNYSTCLKMCCFRDSYVKCLSSGFCLDFIFSFSKFCITLSSTWKKDVWSKRDVDPTCLGQWHLCAHILNPHRCKCEGWTVGKNYFRRKSCLCPGIDSAFVISPCPTPKVVSGSQNNMLLNVGNAICIQLVVTKPTKPILQKPWKPSGSKNITPKKNPKPPKSPTKQPKKPETTTTKNQKKSPIDWTNKTKLKNKQNHPQTLIIGPHTDCAELSTRCCCWDAKALRHSLERWQKRQPVSFLC